MLLLGEENSYLKGTKHTLPKKIVDLYHNIILKYPQFSANGGFRKANHVLENGGVVTMEWLKGMKSFFNKHKDTNDIDFILGGGILVKTFVENKLEQLTASTPKTRKQHTNSPVKPLKPADNLSGNRGEKSSEALSMVKSLMSNIIPKVETKQKLVGDKRIRITEAQLNILKEYLNSNLIPTNVEDFVYHKSNPIFRDEIKKNGLIPKGKSETWLSDTKIDGKVIFATNSDNEVDWFDTTYDDDIYKINTKIINNKWFKDPNFEWYGDDNKHVITFDRIPLNAIELVKLGSGGDLLNEESKTIGDKKDIKTTIKNLKKLPNELKDFAIQHLDSITNAGDGRVSGLVLPSDFNTKLRSENLPNGFLMGVDKDGYYIHTHRARSKSHNDYIKITQKEIKFIDSTG